MISNSQIPLMLQFRVTLWVLHSRGGFRCYLYFYGIMHHKIGNYCISIFRWAHIWGRFCLTCILMFDCSYCFFLWHIVKHFLQLLIANQKVDRLFQLVQRGAPFPGNCGCHKIKNLNLNTDLLPRIQELISKNRMILIGLTPWSWGVPCHLKNRI